MTDRPEASGEGGTRPGAAGGPPPPSQRRPGGPSVRGVLGSILVVAVALLCGAVAAGVVWTRPHTYAAQAALLIDEPQAIAVAPDDGILAKLSAVRAKYTALAATPVVTDVAAADAGLSPSVLATEASAAVSGANPLVLFAQGTGGSPARAERVANAMAQAIGTFATQEQAAEHVAPADRFEIREIGPATAAAKTAPTAQRAIGVALATFLVVLGLCYAGLRLAFPGRREG